MTVLSLPQTSRSRTPLGWLGCIGFAVALLMGTPAARAEPLPTPKIDFALKAKLQDGATMDLAHSGARLRVRVTAPQLPAPVIALVDVPRSKMIALTPNMPKVALEADLPDRYRVAVLSGDGTPMGPSEVAGEPCVLWKINKAQGFSTPAVACITPDGIPLRTDVDSKGKTVTAYEVTSLTRAPQDAALFRLPAGTSAIKVPSDAKGLMDGLNKLGIGR
ncbi:MAG: hypothetical protein B7Z15_05150 [Rhizobiales bacterium 32-66-8]|nr:MAG: hypothetical protein B7Z15_05150 [Rhizobiales bacterium 32-66-8]